MTGQGERWAAEQVLALAPDEASRRAGNKLASPTTWPELGTEAGPGAGAVWGLCRGSGSKPYQTAVDLDGPNGPGYKCSCPSRKFPCKHALGLLLLWSEEQPAEPGGARPVEEAEPPEWASSWLSGRRARSARKAAGSTAAGAGPGDAAGAGSTADMGGSGAGAMGGAGEPAGEREGDGAVARAGSPADRQPARRRAERAQRMAAGAQELEERLADMLRVGLAGADQRGYTAWEQTAARMVDAQARGLADRVRELGAIPATPSRSAGDAEGSAGSWPERLLSEFGLLHLLDQGLLGIDRLPEPLAATVRSRAGLTVDSSEVLADEGSRIRDEWLVLAQRDTLDGRRMTSRQIWLHGRSTGRPALVLSFGAAGRAPALGLPVGAVLDAELAYYPGALTLRAALGGRHGSMRSGFVPAGGTVHDALAAYATALCSDPWLDGWPVVLRDVLPIPPDDPVGPADPADGWQVADGEGESALPVAPGTGSTALWTLLAMSGDGPVTVFGECGHRGFAPYAAWSGTVADSARADAGSAGTASTPGSADATGPEAAELVQL